MFIGEYRHTVDDKNRISLPAKFRQTLGRKIVVTRGLDNCLFLFPVSTWKRIAADLTKFGWTADARGFTRFMFSGATEIEVDSMGRVLVPDFLREFADVKNHVILAGIHDRIEIWNEKRWKDFKKHFESNAEAMAEKFGSVGIK